VQTIFWWTDDVLQWRLQDAQSGYRTAFGVGHTVTLGWPETKTWRTVDWLLLDERKSKLFNGKKHDKYADREQQFRTHVSAGRYDKAKAFAANDR